jgi:hypothetical protein
MLVHLFRPYSEYIEYGRINILNSCLMIYCAFYKDTFRNCYAFKPITIEMLIVHIRGLHAESHLELELNVAIVFIALLFTCSQRLLNYLASNHGNMIIPDQGYSNKL